MCTTGEIVFGVILTCLFIGFLMYCIYSIWKVSKPISNICNNSSNEPIQSVLVVAAETT